MSAAPTRQTQQLSGSASEALRLAQRMAARRGDVPIEVTPLDLLTGVLLAHSDGDALGDLVNQYHPGANDDCLDWLTQSLFHESYADLQQSLTSVSLSTVVPNEPRWTGFDPPLSPAAERVFRRSQALATAHNPLPERWIRLRDLFGGLLLTQSEAQRALRWALEPNGAPFDAIQFTYPRFLNQDDSTSYERFLADNPPYLPVADYDSDDNQGALLERDFLNIAPDVNAFAYLLTARDLHPPLAIGLFGDWGSGKSFFMGSLKQRIEGITRRARTSNMAQNEIAIYRNVVQIEFNAWHYVDANLWASLADHIFTNLKLEERESHDAVEERRLFFMKQLTQQGAALRQAGTEQQNLEASLQHSNERVAQLNAQRAARQHDLRTTAIKAVTLDTDLRKRINDVLTDAGLATVDGENAAGAFLEQLRRAEELYRNESSIRMLLRGHMGWLRVLVAVIVLIAVPALVWGITTIADIPEVASILATIGAVLTAGAATMKAGLDTIDRSLARVKDREREIEQKISDEAPENKEIATLRQQITEIEAEQKLVLEKKQQAETRILEIEKALNGLTPASLLSGFIQSKSGSDDYRKHLGLASLIRRDFDELSRLISGYNLNLNNVTASSAKDPGEKSAEEVASESEKAELERKHHINRIILYIDDLDRCPPEQVIQVLQAVHLLLAFPLFVVVVAVDARWLAQSLKSHYRGLLQGNGQSGAPEELELATPEDYLEKIFQIPFWIRPLNDDDRAQLLQGLLDETTRGGDDNRLGVSRLDQSIGGQAAVGVGNQGDTTSAQSSVTAAQGPDRADSTGPREIPIDLNPVGLDLTTDERDFMQDIQPLLGRSPRSVKRFFNVYRLVKSRVGATGGEFVSDADQANYRVVMVLLAVVTGMPAVSRGLFRGIAAAAPTDTLNDVIAAARTQVAGTPEACEDWERMTTWLAADSRASWRTAHPAEWTPWAAHVSRFSYRMEWNDT